LGGAEFMLILDHPYEAEKLYKLILMFDPNNPAAKAGMLAVQEAKRPTWQTLGHYYTDTHDVRLYTYGAGPTFRMRHGNLTITSGTGHYRNNNDPNNSRNPISLTP